MLTFIFIYFQLQAALDHPYQPAVRQSLNQFNGTVSPVGAFQKYNVSFFHYRIAFKVDESEMFSMQFSLLTVLSRFSR